MEPGHSSGAAATFRMEDAMRRPDSPPEDTEEAADAEDRHREDAEADSRLDEELRRQIEAVEEDVAQSGSGEPSVPGIVAEELREAGVPAGQWSPLFLTFQHLEKGRGHVTQDDLYTGMQLLGECPQSREQVRHLLLENGWSAENLSLRDFAVFCTRVCRSRDEIRADLEASCQLLKARRGFLDRGTLRRAIFGPGGAEDDSEREDFEELMRLADSHRDGRVDCGEFCRLLTMRMDEMR